MVSDLSTSFISDALKSSRADSPAPSLPARSKNPTPCLYSTTCFTGNSAGKPSVALRRRETKMRLIVYPIRVYPIQVYPIQECRRERFPFTSSVGQVVNLRRIGNPPAASGRQGRPHGLARPASLRQIHTTPQ